MLKLTLYCPHCHDRTHHEPLTADLEEPVLCTSCYTETRRCDLLTDAGLRVLDHLILAKPSGA